MTKFILSLMLTIICFSFESSSQEKLDELLEKEFTNNASNEPKSDLHQLEKLMHDTHSNLKGADYIKYNNFEISILDKISGKIYKLNGLVGSKFEFKDYEFFVYSCFKRHRLFDEYAYLVSIWEHDKNHANNNKIFLGWLFSYDKHLNYIQNRYIDIAKIVCY